MDELTFRTAVAADLDALVRMLFDDALGSQREQVADPLPPAYQAAFDAIDADANNEILVAELEGEVVASLQMVYTPSLSYQGGWRATMESVRTVSALRGRGIGGKLVEWAIQRARDRGCRLVQLSTNATRADAQRFYLKLGFKPTHVGMKMDLGG